MKIVIDIPEEIYESSKRECKETDDLIIDTFTLAIGNGTPLPKGHEDKLVKIQEIIKEHDDDTIPEDFWYIDRIKEIIDINKGANE